MSRACARHRVIAQSARDDAAVPSRNTLQRRWRGRWHEIAVLSAGGPGEGSAFASTESRRKSTSAG